MQRGRPTRTPSLTSSLADSRSPSPYARSRPHSRPPYPATHQNNVRWSSVSPDDPLRNSSSYAPPPQQHHSSSSRRRDSFNANRPPTPPQKQPEREKAKRRPSVSFLTDQIKGKVKDEKPNAKDVKDKVKESSALKTSLVFLGSVAAATYVANRFWPRGVTYGEKEAWEEDRRQQGRRRRRSASQRRGERASFEEEEEASPRLYRRGRGIERVVYAEDPIRRAPSRGGRSDHSAAGYTVVRTAASRPVSTTRQEQRFAEVARGGDGRRPSSSSYYYYDGGDRCYYSTRRHDGDDARYDDYARNGAGYREPRYVEHQVTTLRRSSSDDPYTTTERVVRRQYHLDDR
ncbi:hypothetical protein PG993_013120 [Apiospora rasikravindrae]|uniref:Transmembrane protein n=1 Tax=Apiospora rasikravindrae TaxID=990691 RepID=A0ABR1RWU6_9PEZI